MPRVIVLKPLASIGRSASVKVGKREHDIETTRITLKRRRGAEGTDLIALEGQTYSYGIGGEHYMGAKAEITICTDLEALIVSYLRQLTSIG